MKYFKRLGIYKASHVTFNPNTKEGFSYDWWKVSGMFKGKLFLNVYSYSNSTARHIHKIRLLISEPYISIEAPKGLDNFESIKSHYEYKIKALQAKVKNPLTRKRDFYKQELAEAKDKLKIAAKYMKYASETKKEKEISALEMAGSIAALASVFCDTQEEKNKWKQRMIGTVPGISIPEDFDKLPEEEKQKRLDGVIKISQEKI